MLLRPLINIEILDEVLGGLRKEGLTVGRDKCNFCKSEFDYLGYVINSKCLLVDPDKVDAILNIPILKNA